MKPVLYIKLEEFYNPPFLYDHYRIGEFQGLVTGNLDDLLIGTKKLQKTVSIFDLLHADKINESFYKEHHLFIFFPMPQDSWQLIVCEGREKWFELLDTTLRVLKKYPNSRIITGNDWDEYNIIDSLGTDLISLILNIFRNNQICLSRLTWLHSNSLTGDWVKQRLFDNEKPVQTLYYSSYLPRLKERGKQYDFEENLKTDKSFWFLCLNSKARDHRMYLSWYWFNNKRQPSYWSCRASLRDHTLRSMDIGDGSQNFNPYEKEFQLLNEFYKARHDLDNYTTFCDSLPWKIDHYTGQITYDRMDTVPTSCVYESACYIITETQFYNKKGINRYYNGWFSEKTLKTFLWGMPALWLAPPDTIKGIRKLGFKSFKNMINESYDQEERPKVKMELAIKEIEKLQNVHNIDYWYKSGIDIYKHNYKILSNLWDRDILKYIENFHNENVNWVDTQLHFRYN